MWIWLKCFSGHGWLALLDRCRLPRFMMTGQTVDELIICGRWVDFKILSQKQFVISNWHVPSFMMIGQTVDELWPILSQATFHKVNWLLADKPWIRFGLFAGWGAFIWKMQDGGNAIRQTYHKVVPMAKLLSRDTWISVHSFMSIRLQIWDYDCMAF